MWVLLYGEREDGLFCWEVEEEGLGGCFGRGVEGGFVWGWLDGGL